VIRVSDEGFESIEPETLDGYEPLSNAIGGLIELVPVKPDYWAASADSDTSLTIWCNEEGKLLGLPFNKTATELWAAVDEYGCVEAGDRLVGTVVVQGPVDENGDTTDCPDWVFDWLKLKEEFENAVRRDQ